MSNFINDFYRGIYDDDCPYVTSLSSGILEQSAYDMALNKYLIGCMERLDSHSFILIHNCDLYQVIFIDEDNIIVQMVKQKSEHVYELVNNTLKIMNAKEYGEFVKDTKY